MKTGDNDRVFTAGVNDSGKRIDRIMRKLFPGLPLSALYRLFRRGSVFLNGRKARTDERVERGDEIRCTAALESIESPSIRKTGDLARKRAADRLNELVIFHNEHLLAVNKPYGILVHGTNSLTELLLTSPVWSPDASLTFAPGPVHRLDRNTTGVQLFALSLVGARSLTRLFHDRGVKKIYCGLVEGRIDAPARWEDLLSRDREKRKTVTAAAEPNSLRAVTTVVPLVSTKSESLLLFLPETGRTHQIRFQAAQRRHPLCGDVKYGSASSLPRYFLHSLGLAVSRDDPVFPPLLAPFDPFERDLIQTLFGKNILETITARARDLLERDTAD